MLSHRTKREDRVELQWPCWEFKIKTICTVCTNLKNHNTEACSQTHTKMYIHKLVSAVRSWDSGCLEAEWVERNVRRGVTGVLVILCFLICGFILWTFICTLMFCVLFCIIQYTIQNVMLKYSYHNGKSFYSQENRKKSLKSHNANFYQECAKMRTHCF